MHRNGEQLAAILLVVCRGIVEGRSVAMPELYWKFRGMPE